MNKAVLPPSLCALLFLAGCVFEPYRETARFDLTVVPTEAAPVRPVMVLELRNDSSSGLRIQSRAASGEVIGDESGAAPRRGAESAAALRLHRTLRG